MIEAIAVPTTANTSFHSKSPSIGTSRWKVQTTFPEQAAYVFDMLPYRDLYHSADNRWYAITVWKDLEWVIECRCMGNGESVEITEEAVMEATILFKLTFPPEINAREKFERLAGNIMHGRLPPIQSAWVQVAGLAG